MSKPLDQLIRGIVTKWAAEATLNVIAGPHRGERPTGASANPASGTQFPYCIIPPGNCPLTQVTCGREYHEPVVRLRVYDTTPENCGNHASTVKTIFDSDSLSLVLSGITMHWHRPLDEIYGQEDKNVWYVEIPYVFRISKARTA